MFINPEHAITNGWITHPDCETIDDWKKFKFLSPNAIDFPLDKVFEINDDRYFCVSNTAKVMKGATLLEPTPLPILDKNVGVPEFESERIGWEIKENQTRDCLSSMYCNLPIGVSAMLVIRSTLARNSLTLASGLYDSGFTGHIGFVLRNHSTVPAYIVEGTRVGQIIFVASGSKELYEGGYNHQHDTNLQYQYPPRFVD